jgi:thymidylate synthase (FAD)
MIANKEARNGEEKMSRVTVPAADAMIGVLMPVLDHGFIGLVDYMGSDESIVQAARVSYGRGTRRVSDDRGLIRYLMRHEHTTPFEMVELKFIAKMPITVARQWVRHRTASINEYSGRYSIMSDDDYLPPLEMILPQSTSNRQGRDPSGLDLEKSKTAQEIFKGNSEATHDNYKKLLDLGIARETSRGVLPVHNYTEWYWKANLHNIFHFLSLRLDEHAQWETREYAKEMALIVKTVTPIAYEAFEDFELSGLRLSRQDQRALAVLLRGSGVAVEEACKTAGLDLTKSDGTQIKMGEGPEFLQKLRSIQNRLN